MAARSDQLAKIKTAQYQLQTATGIHRKDLQRCLHRLQKELRIYDKYRKGGTPCPVAHTPTVSPT